MPVADEIDLLQRQIDALRRETEHLGRLATLGTLAATLAHEFNNVLTPAAGHARLGRLALDDGDLPRARRALEKCEAAATRAGRLSAAVLDLARPTRGEAGEAGEATADVAAAVEAAVDLLGRDLAADGIDFTASVPPGLAVAVDPARLEQALLNLLLNARRALLARPAGGRRLRVEAVSGTIVRIDVSDTGGGMPAGLLADGFGPFRRGVGGGSGLGLDLCRRVAEGAGGRIEAANVGGGCRVRLWLSEASRRQLPAAA